MMHEWLKSLSKVNAEQKESLENTAWERCIYRNLLILTINQIRERDSIFISCHITVATIWHVSPVQQQFQENTWRLVAATLWALISVDWVTE